jgi:MFS family permease
MTMTLAQPGLPERGLDAAASQVAAEQTSGWKTVFACAAGLTFGPSVITVFGFGAFINPLDREFGWSVSSISLGATIVAIMIMILAPLQGLLVDRFGGRRLVLWSIPAFGLSLCAMYFLPNNLLVFYLAWVVIPLCGLGIWPISYLRLTAGWFDKNLGLAFGVTNAGIGVGAVVVPLLTAFFISRYGWREAFVCLGVVALLVWPIAFLFLKESGRQTSPMNMQGDTLSEAARTKPFWIAVAGFFLLGIFSASILVHHVRILIDAGIPPATAILLPAALGASLVLARLLTGWLLDRFPASWLMAIFLVGGAVAAALYSRGPDLPLAILSAALVGLVVGAEFDVLSYIIPRYHGRKSFGRIYGVIFAVFQFASAIAAFAVGYSRSQLGSYAPAMMALVVVCLICALLFTQLGAYRFKAGERTAVK